MDNPLGSTRYANKTRVLIFSSAPAVSQLLKYILTFNEQGFDVVNDEKTAGSTDHDFVIFETNNLESVAAFHPNIVLVTHDIAPENLSTIAENMVAGGVMIFPETSADQIEAVTNYFRKIPFGETEFNADSEHTSITTEMGNMPIKTGDEILLRNLEGIKLLSQQLTVMADEFYDAVLAFGEDAH